MATHNVAMMAGYLLQRPTIQNEGVVGEEKAFLYIRTMRRESDNAGKDKFEDIMLYYDGEGQIMDKIRKLEQFDIIIVKGVLNIVTADKAHQCPICNSVNIKENGSYPFIYPNYLKKEDNIRNSFEYQANLPEAILANHYREISNFMLIMGTVVSKPEMIGTEKHPCCRYKLGVDRKFYIPSQPDTIADYPWVYSYGEQAERDFRHLEEGSIIMVDGYYHTRVEEIKTTCETCGAEYSYTDVVMDFIPYSVEYLVYKTDEEIAKEEELKRRTGQEYS